MIPGLDAAQFGRRSPGPLRALVFSRALFFFIFSVFWDVKGDMVYSLWRTTLVGNMSLSSATETGTNFAQIFTLSRGEFIEFCRGVLVVRESVGGS